MEGQTESTFLKDYQPGEVFGELCLLYNTPRAASIVATSDCVLFSLDRKTFNHIGKGNCFLNIRVDWAKYILSG